MKRPYNVFRIPLFILALMALQPLHAQDKIYLTNGAIINGRIDEIKISRVTYTDSALKELRTINSAIIDSIVYADGSKDLMPGISRKKRELLRAIRISPDRPRFNTLAFGLDVFGCAISYERRLKNGLVGFRIPLYVGYLGGGLAGNGAFDFKRGFYALRDINYFHNNDSVSYISAGGGSMAIGFNPRFYFGKNKKVQGFAGPEIVVGVITASVAGFANGSDTLINTSPPSYLTFGTVGFSVLAGVSINPKPKFNLAIQGGLGVSDVFGAPNPVNWTGTWRLGITLGGNF